MINREISKLQKQQSDLHAQYQGLVKAGDSALLEYTRMANEHNTHFYTQLDSNAARVLEKIANAAEYLVTGAQEIKRHQSGHQ